jgi:plasmid stabilization system protein ParE
VPRVEVARSAAADLDRLIRTHSLPKNTKQRIKRSLRPLGRFPRLGPELSGRWAGFRFVLGPWRWMIVVYVYFEDENRVVVTTIQDARSSSAARSGE